MDLEPDQRGALVAEVVPDSPADKAGLRGSEDQVEIDGFSMMVGGDVIVAVDEQDIKGMDVLIAYIATETSVGQEISLTVIRYGEKLDLNLILGARPDLDETRKESFEQPGRVYIGIAGLELVPEIAEAMELESGQEGILVIDVEPGSPADKANLRAGQELFDLQGEEFLVGGDVVIGYDGEKISNFDQLRYLVGQSEAGQEVELLILRDGDEIPVMITLEER